MSWCNMTRYAIVQYHDKCGTNFVHAYFNRVAGTHAAVRLNLCVTFTSQWTHARMLDCRTMKASTRDWRVPPSMQQFCAWKLSALTHKQKDCIKKAFLRIFSPASWLATGFPLALVVATSCAQRQENSSYIMDSQHVCMYVCVCVCMYVQMSMVQELLNFPVVLLNITAWMVVSHKAAAYVHVHLAWG